MENFSFHFHFSFSCNGKTIQAMNTGGDEVVARGRANNEMMEESLIKKRGPRLAQPPADIPARSMTTSSDPEVYSLEGYRFQALHLASLSHPQNFS